MEAYPQYSLAHFYRYNFKEGGLTNDQIEVLFTHAKKREIENLKWLAAIHGVKIGDDEKSEFGGEFEGCIKGRPETYAHLTQEQLRRWVALQKAKRFGYYKEPTN